MLIRKVVPNYNLDEELNQKFVLILKSLRKKLQPIFSKYLMQEEFEISETTTRLKDKILGIMSAGNIALISANSSKKILKNLGVDPRFLIVSGGPLFYEDYKELNPTLPEEALEGIKKKCERLILQIQSEKWEGRDLVFIHEKDNAADKLILNKLKQISNLIGKTVKIIEIGSWKDLENQ